METKTDLAKRLVKEGRYHEAMKLVKGFKIFDNKQDGEDIKTAWDAQSNDSFYRQIGKDPIALYEKGLDIMIGIYGVKHDYDDTIEESEEWLKEFDKEMGIA